MELLLKQTCGPLGAGQGQISGKSFFVATTGIGTEANLTCGATHPGWREHGGFQPDAGGGAGDTAGQAAHDSGNGHWTVVAGHHLHPIGQDELALIESDELLSVTGGADGKTAGVHRLARDPFERVAVEGMQRLALFEHHQIGDVDNRIHAVDAGTLQPLTEPVR